MHVHVNGLHVLNNSNNNGGEITGFTYGARKDDANHPHPDQPVVVQKVARGTSTTDMQQQHNHNTKMEAEEDDNSNFF